MRKVILALVISAAVFGAVFVLLPGRRASQPAPAASKSSLAQRDAGEGAVEIEVTLVVAGSTDAAKYGAETQTVFLVSMNTHSIDLSVYDLTQVSELLAAGQRLAPIRWVSTSDDSHHRTGALIFPKVNQRVPLELRIKAIAGVAVRTFRWAP